MASPRTVAVIAAAGRGERMGAGVNKAFLALVDRPVLAHTLGVFQDSPLVGEIVVAVGAGEEDFCRREIIEPFKLDRVTGLIRGGATRQETVGLALSYIGSSADLIVVHDGARPLLPPGLLDRAIEVGIQRGAVVVGLPARDTVKLASGAATVFRSDLASTSGPAEVQLVPVSRTLARDALWQVQTPQVFWRDLLAMAYERGDGVPATDDATLVERLRHPVFILPGSEENIKVTTPLDLVIARAILDSRARRPRPDKSGRPGSGTGP